MGRRVWLIILMKSSLSGLYDTNHCRAFVIPLQSLCIGIAMVYNVGGALSAHVLRRAVLLRDSLLS